MKKVSILLLILSLFMFPITVSAASAAENTGSIGIVLQKYDQNTLKKCIESEDGNGVYVFIKEIDAGKIYRFPLSQSNQFEGRYEIPYGNYRVIDNPDKNYNVTCASVFNISSDSPAPSIACALEEKKTPAISQSPSNSSNKDTKKNSEQKKPEKSQGVNFQLVITIAVFIILCALWIYNRFIKFRDE